MNLRFYSNAISRASKSIAAAIFIVGLLLIGFGVIIWALPEVFAFLAAAVFFIAGVGACATAVRIFLAQRRLRSSQPSQNGTRENVRIHIEEHYDS